MDSTYLEKPDNARMKKHLSGSYDVEDFIINKKSHYIYYNKFFASPFVTSLYRDIFKRTLDVKVLALKDKALSVNYGVSGGVLPSLYLVGKGFEEADIRRTVLFLCQKNFIYDDLSKKVIFVSDSKQVGKDYVAAKFLEYLDEGATPTSFILSKEIVYPILKNIYKYSSWEECYNDRDNHREEWKSILSNYGEAKFHLKLLESSNVSIGVRDYRSLDIIRKELLAKDIIPLIIFVTSNEERQIDQTSTIEEKHCDYVFVNKKGKTNFENEFRKLVKFYDRF